MTFTPVLGIAELAPSQAIPEVTVNEAVRYLEQGARWFVFLDRDLTAPPGSPTDGDAYLIATGGTGAWSGHDGEIAYRFSTSWNFIVPSEGMAAWIADENAAIVFDGSAWAELSGSGGGVSGTASTTEVLTGTDNAKATTPDAVAALWEQGSDVASAATISFGEGGFFKITGTTTITDIDFGTDKAGRKVDVVFTGALTLTHSANLILPTGASIITVAGDTACFVSEGSDVVRCLDYTRASGTAIVGGGIAGAAGSFFTGWSGGLLTGDTTAYATKGTTFNPNTNVEIHRMIAAINATAGGQAHYCQIATVNAATGQITAVVATSNTVNSLGTTQEWHEFSFSPAVNLTSGADYIFALVNASGSGTTVCRFGSCTAGRPNVPGSSGRTQWRYNTIGLTAGQTVSASGSAASYALCLEGFFS